MAEFSPTKTLGRAILSLIGFFCKCQLKSVALDG